MGEKMKSAEKCLCQLYKTRLSVEQRIKSIFLEKIIWTQLLRFFLFNPEDLKGRETKGEIISYSIGEDDCYFEQIRFRPRKSKKVLS